MKNAMLRIATLGIATVIAACSPQVASKKSTELASNAGNEVPLVGSVQMVISDSTGTVYYSDADPSTSQRLRAGVNYNLFIDATNIPAGSTITASLTNISVVMGAPIVLNLQPGNNPFSVNLQGDYSLQITVSVSGMAPRVQSYQLAATCANPTFTAASLNPNGISVSGTTNNYNYSAAAVVASANGSAPYSFAWDGTGTGIVDTAFSQNSSYGPFFSDLVGARNIGLVVKDACNIAHTVQKVVNLPYSVPSMPGNVFIFGETDVNTATPDPRYDGVEYLVDAKSGGRHIDAHYANGSFTIEAHLDQNMPSSLRHGIRIELRGIQETTPINPATMTGDINVSNAYIYRLTYTTDRAGDSAAAVSLSGTQASCRLFNQDGRTAPVTGTPCASGSGTNNGVTVEVWGEYECTLSGADHPVTITGKFDGYYMLGDACIGGGGGGGGGIPDKTY